MGTIDKIIRVGLLASVTSITLVFFLLFASELPARIPLYLNLTGDIAPAWLPVTINILLFFLYILIKRLKKTSCTGGCFLLTAFALVLVNTTAVIVMEETLFGHIHLERMLVIVLFMGLAFLGLMMHPEEDAVSLGLPTPWVTGLPDVWYFTQRFTSHLWAITGTFSIFAAIFILNFWLYYYFLAILILMILLPFWYSYRLYIKQRGL